MEEFYYFIVKQGTTGRLGVYTRSTTPPQEQFDSLEDAFKEATALNASATHGDKYLAFASAEAEQND